MSKKLFVISSIVLLLFGTAFGLGLEGKFDQEKEIDELIGNLGTRYWGKAADELVEIGEAAVEPLIKIVNVGSGRPSENAILVLARIGTLKAMDAVIGALQNPGFDFRVRAYAAMALGDTESEDRIVVLIEALQTDNHWWVRNFAVGSLGKIGSERAVEPIIGALNDKNMYVRRAAVSVLGELKPDKAILPLIEALRDEDWQIRLQAPEILVEFGNETEKHLLEALKNDNKWIKVGAANVLGRIGSESAVLPIMSLLNNQERMVRDEAAVALSRLNSKVAVKALLDLLKHETSYVREGAAWVLGEMRSKAADQDSRVGQAAAWALARMLIDEIENS